MIKAIVLDDDIAEYRRVIEEHRASCSRDAPVTDEEVEEYFAYFYKLVREPGPQLVTHEYAAEMVSQFFDLSSSRRACRSTPTCRREFVILQRINLGLYAILARLEARPDWLAIARSCGPSTRRAAVDRTWAPRKRLAGRAKLTRRDAQPEVDDHEPGQGHVRRPGRNQGRPRGVLPSRVEAPLMATMGGRPVLLQRYPNGAQRPVLLPKAGARQAARVVADDGRVDAERNHVGRARARRPVATCCGR